LHTIFAPFAFTPLRVPIFNIVRFASDAEGGVNAALRPAKTVSIRAHPW